MFAPLPRRLAAPLLAAALFARPAARAEPAAAPKAAPPEAVLADEVVAVVDARSILLSELDVETRLARARAEGPAALFAAPDGPALAATLQRLVNEYVLFAEAERLQVFELSEADLAGALAELRRTVGADALARLADRFNATDRTLESILRRELRVARYLEGRFRLAARPREADVHAAARAEGESRPTDEALAHARERLARERFETLTRDFTAEVRRRAKVRVLRDLESGSGTTPLSGSVDAPDAAAADAASRGRGGGG